MILRIISQIFASAFGAIIGALIVQLATKIVAKYKPPYDMAYKATFLGYLSTVVIIFVGTFGVEFNELSIFSRLAMIIAIPLVEAVIYTHLIESPEKQPLGFGDACMVSLIHFFLIFVVIIALVSFLSSLSSS